MAGTNRTAPSRLRNNMSHIICLVEQFFVPVEIKVSWKTSHNQNIQNIFHDSK